MWVVRSSWGVTSGCGVAEDLPAFLAARGPSSMQVIDLRGAAIPILQMSKLRHTEGLLVPARGCQGTERRFSASTSSSSK